MTASNIFSFGNTFVLLGWLLLLLAPHWKHTHKIILNGIIVVLCILYAYLIGKGLENFDVDSFSSLEKVKVLFQNDDALAAGWLHYLAFDLFFGAYVVNKSIELGLPRWLYTLILPFTFMFGPVGYLLYVGVSKGYAV